MRYIARNSNLPAWEFAQLSGRPLLGRFVWCLAKLGLVDLDSTEIPPPGSSREQLCSEDDVPPRLKAVIQSRLEDAATLGFANSLWYYWQSSDGEHMIAVVRLWNANDRHWIQVAGSCFGPAENTESLVMSCATRHPDTGGIRTYGTSDFRAKLSSPDFVQAQYLPGASAQRLLEQHLRAYESEIAHCSQIGDEESLIALLDAHGDAQYDHMQKRGIWVPAGGE